MGRRMPPAEALDSGCYCVLIDQAYINLHRHPDGIRMNRSSHPEPSYPGRSQSQGRDVETAGQWTNPIRLPAVACGQLARPAPGFACHVPC